MLSESSLLTFLGGYLPLLSSSLLMDWYLPTSMISAYLFFLKAARSASVEVSLRIRSLQLWNCCNCIFNGLDINEKR